MNNTLLKPSLLTAILFALGSVAPGCGAPEEDTGSVEKSGDQGSAKQELAPVLYQSGVGPGLCLDVQGGVPSWGTRVQIWGCNGTNAQQWIYDPSTGEVRSTLAPNLCLDVQGGGAAWGTIVQIWGCNGTNAQKWIRTPANEFRSFLGWGLCLDVRGGAAAWGTPVQIWGCNSTPAQQWY